MSIEISFSICRAYRTVDFHADDNVRRKCISEGVHRMWFFKIFYISSQIVPNCINIVPKSPNLKVFKFSTLCNAIIFSTKITHSYNLLKVCISYLFVHFMVSINALNVSHIS